MHGPSHRPGKAQRSKFHASGFAGAQNGGIGGYCVGNRDVTVRGLFCTGFEMAWRSAHNEHFAWRCARLMLGMGGCWFKVSGPVIEARTDGGQGSGALVKRIASDCQDDDIEILHQALEEILRDLPAVRQDSGEHCTAA